MRGKPILVLALVLFLLGIILGLDAISSRPVDIYHEYDRANLLPMFVTLGAGIAVLVVFGAVNYVPSAGNTAPPYMGRMGSLEKGEIDKTLEKSGEMKRIGGEF
jgi:hypothetical protein